MNVNPELYDGYLYNGELPPQVVELVKAAITEATRDYRQSKSKCEGNRHVYPNNGWECQCKEPRMDRRRKMLK